MYTDKNEHLASFDSLGVSEWENNFIVNKLVDVDGVEGITALTLGMPYIPHEQSENRQGCNFMSYFWTYFPFYFVTVVEL